MARLVIGIILGVVLSFISVSLFSLWIPFILFLPMLGTDLMGAIVFLLAMNFSFDMIGLFMPFSATGLIYAIFNAVFLAWFFTCYIAGSIAKGAKRGLLAGVIIVVVVLLLWILLSVISGVNLMTLFQGAQLMITLGGIVGALVPGLLGGVLGGVVSGPFEEFY